MSLLRRGPLVTATVDVYDRRGAAVTIVPGPKRWPEHEASDRLVVPLGIAALALARAQDAVMGSVQDRLRHAATAIVDAALVGESLSTFFAATSGLEFVEARDERGSPHIEARLVRSAVGPIPTVGRTAHPSPTLALAGAAALAVCLVRVPPATRLAAALSIEGLLGWYKVADPHLQPPQQAVAYSLRHAVARLSEEGRLVPDALSAAVKANRKITPMAGGA